ncbi:hypothetical protein BO82DRAFT_26839 [Aspergillus uvarum CBS 121591]|uniref:Uncharacterized protein n=1 Tax=Aspergillus uvarum CBS 121591 TaxID=1448315 RepID=A0A319CGE6_9EURO|nr:hypothetical protein BO82DRAFT_26839 [Aspergillus uvarum CBS 121591]PYH84294.1 hypothetical protein BO82DRAFT_26839 [Aspergillus uvarum CBS 121591]
MNCSYLHCTLHIVFHLKQGMGWGRERQPVFDGDNLFFGACLAFPCLCLGGGVRCVILFGGFGGVCALGALGFLKGENFGTGSNPEGRDRSDEGVGVLGGVLGAQRERMCVSVCVCVLGGG